MQPGDQIFSVLFPVGDPTPRVIKATVTKVTDKRAYYDRESIPGGDGEIPIAEAKPFSLPGVQFSSLINGGVHGGYPNPLSSICAAIVSLVDEQTKLHERATLALGRINELEQLRVELLEDVHSHAETLEGITVANPIPGSIPGATLMLPVPDIHIAVGPEAVSDVMSSCEAGASASTGTSEATGEYIKLVGEPCPCCSALCPSQAFEAERGNATVKPTRCQATETPASDAVQCLLPVGHAGDHDFRPDTAAVWEDIQCPTIDSVDPQDRR